MKIKGDHITNSSSTSFVLASSKPSLGTVDIVLKANLDKYVETRIRTEGELKAYIYRNYGEDDYENSRNDDIILMHQAIKDGKTVFILNVADCSGDPIEDFLCAEGIPDRFNKDIDVIIGDGGY